MVALKNQDCLYILCIYHGDRSQLVYRGIFTSEESARLFFDGYKSCAYCYLPSEDILLYSIMKCVSGTQFGL